MVQSLKLLIVLLLFATPCYAVDYSADGNCVFFAGMEDTGNEVPEVGTTVIESGGTIDRSTTKKFGTYSRDLNSGEYFTHADGNETDINGAGGDGTGNISVVLWIRRDVDSGTQEGLVTKYDATGNQRQYIVGISNGDKIWCRLSWNGTAVSDALGNTSLGTGAWVHVGVVYNDTDIRIYKDGSLDGNGSNPLSHTTGIGDLGAEFIIGGYEDNNAFAKPFDGLIDDVAIFDRDLSSAEVNDIMNNGVQGSGRTAQTILTSLE